MERAFFFALGLVTLFLLYKTRRGSQTSDPSPGNGRVRVRLDASPEAVKAVEDMAAKLGISTGQVFVRAITLLDLSVEGILDKGHRLAFIDENEEPVQVLDVIGKSSDGSGSPIDSQREPFKLYLVPPPKDET